MDPKKMEDVAEAAGLGTPDKLVYLDWANGWSKTPEIRRKCLNLGHNCSDVSDAPGVPYKCSDHTVTCEICGYYFKYNSG
jgi:hypothetical protein